MNLSNQLIAPSNSLPQSALVTAPQQPREAHCIVLGVKKYFYIADITEVQANQSRL